MAKGTIKSKAIDLDDPKRLGPTKAQFDRAEFVEVEAQDKRPGRVTVSMGTVWKRRNMIDILGAQGLFSDAEVKALKHYRHHADIADKSPLQDSLGKLVRVSGGCGHGPTVETLNARYVAKACEDAAGSLAPILRAVIVDDMSLSQWAIRKSGSIEKCRERKGRRVCTVEAKEGALRLARLDIQMAAKRVEAELDA